MGAMESEGGSERAGLVPDHVRRAMKMEAFPYDKAPQPGCRARMTNEMFALKCMWDVNKQQMYKTTSGRYDLERMMRQGCSGDPWGRDQKVKKESTR